MTDDPVSPAIFPEIPQPVSHVQYQNQPVTMHNTLGLLFMSILAIVLLVALVRQQSRSQDLLAKLSNQ